jgi:hypothetical protein
MPCLKCGCFSIGGSSFKKQRNTFIIYQGTATPRPNLFEPGTLNCTPFNVADGLYYVEHSPWV